MKVRRKPEIREAVQDEHGFWTVDGLPYPISGEEFAAHYEPVPEPEVQPDIEHFALGISDVIYHSPFLVNTEDKLHSFLVERLMTFHAALQPAAPSVEERTSIAAHPGSVGTSISELSEEQPAVFGTPQPEDLERTIVGKVDLFLRKVDAHRATIALIQHPDAADFWGVKLANGEHYRFYDRYIWGTEAEAKAKMESLRGENNGGK